jgi:predicted RND superfamily exporter protein
MSKPAIRGSAIVAYTKWLIRWRWPVLAFTFAVAAVLASGGRFLAFSDNYRVFFGETNPQLQAFEALQDIYTKNDNILIVLAPEDGDVFTPTTLAAVEDLTRESWQVPFAIRVDAITNFQHTEAEGDDLLVDDLIIDAPGLTEPEIERARATALAEPLLLNRIIPEGSAVTGVNITLQLPGESLTEIPEATAFARQLAADIEDNYPGITTYLSGMVMLNNAFSEAAQNDIMTLVPIMYLGIVVVMGLMLRSLSGTIATVLVIGLSVTTAMGIAGWLGIQITPPSASAPTMIMTLAIADSIHILVTMLRAMRLGASKHEALIESLRINMQPVFLTSATTAVGFLSMNFSDVPPFHDLGNMTAMGVLAAFAFSVFTLPALMSVFPRRVRRFATGEQTAMDRLGGFVVDRRRPLLWGTAAVVMVLAALIPRNDLNDRFVDYFDESVTFRTDTDFMTENLTGVYNVEFSLKAGESGGISNPEYLETLARFSDWYKEQPGVVHVNSIHDTFKRLNKSMHGDDPAWYVLPDNRELTAQYLLLYELSLPYGLDLNNQINVDKSATRFTVTLDDMTSREIREAAFAGEAWLTENAPPHMLTEGAGSSVMFAHISERSIKSMLVGNVFAFVVVSALLIVAFRSFKFGVLSLIPNMVPAVMAFGVWAILVAQVNIGLSTVVAMTLGIVVDDTVHFLSKYLRARREQGVDPQEAVRYAFSSVGTALVVTSGILVVGFMVLSLSSFDLNAGMGKMAAITIAVALVADFFLLPPLLMLLDRSKKWITKEELPLHGEEHETPIAVAR